jgi:NAD(P)-dependent dehydrogenase (short-subunit alcohol dehydrogenase family)
MTSPASLFDLTGKTAIVTGASSGLGWQFALVLARAGAKVALAARRLDRLTELARQIEAFDGRAIPIVLDVTDVQSVRGCVAAAETELGPISILINNAGIGDSKPIFEQSEADWDSVIDVNLKGVWLMAQETARHMSNLGHGGSIVNVASILGLIASGRVPSYSASKAGVVNLTRSLAISLARYNIRVNAIAPGYIETDINREFLHSPAGKEMITRIPQLRSGSPQDLDGALLLLASDASRFMTGSTIVVDGGQTAGI